MRLGLCLIFISSLLLSCQVSRQTEDYHFKSVADLTLGPSNHPHGYLRNECFLCHLPQNIHQENRLGAPSFDLAKPMVEALGLSSCIGCHGNNGVTP